MKAVFELTGIDFRVPYGILGIVVFLAGLGIAVLAEAYSWGLKSLIEWGRFIGLTACAFLVILSGLALMFYGWR